MATNNKKTAKPSKNAKPASNGKKATPAKKTVAIKKVPVKQAVKKTPAKPTAKTASGKKTTPTTKTAAKAPAKKVVSNTKNAKNNNQKTVNKKNSKQATPAKKATPVKKAATPKKTAPAKKAAPVAKKAIITKPTAKAPAKPAPKAPAKPAPKVSAKPAPKAPAKPEIKAAPAKLPSKPGKKLTITQMPVKVNPAAPKPMATPAARSTEKKPNVIIAHRRMENKSKTQKESASTMIHYQPETYRSILDEPQQQQGPVYRYSDEELAEFREIITSRLEAARKELNYLQGLITRKDEAGTEDTENRYMNMEDGSGAMEREQLAQLASRQIQFMGHLEKALVRIENKTYGICRVTGKLIDKARLRAVPHATLSIEAKKLMAAKQSS